MAVRLGAGGNDLVAGVIAVALATGVTAAAGAVEAGDAESSPDCSVSSARTEELAFELAEVCAKDIEIESLRTVYDTFWATPRQTIRADASSGAVRTDLSGRWQATDSSVRLDGSGVPQVAAPVYEMDLVGEVAEGGPFVTMRADSLALSMGLPDGLGLGVHLLGDRERRRCRGWQHPRAARCGSPGCSSRPQLPDLWYAQHERPSQPGKPIAYASHS